MMPRRPVIEFDAECRGCKKLITLRVRSEQVRAFFQRTGVLCDVCYEPGYRSVPLRWAA